MKQILTLEQQKNDNESSIHFLLISKLIVLTVLIKVQRLGHDGLVVQFLVQIQRQSGPQSLLQTFQVK